jgi:hypothetical protein
MNPVSEDDKNFSINIELNQHMPKAFQKMLKIEQMAQDRLQQIKNSVETWRNNSSSYKAREGIALILKTEFYILGVQKISKPRKRAIQNQKQETLTWFKELDMNSSGLVE